MSDDFLIKRLGELVLVRLLDGPKGVTKAVLKRDLEPLTRGRLEGIQFDELLDDAINFELSRNSIEERKPAKTSKFFLTDAGRQTALKFLGANRLPEKTTWAKLKGTYLPARALGVPQIDAEKFKRVSGMPGLRAAILSQKYNLLVDPAPTPKRALDALLWRQLGVETEKEFSMSAVKQYLLGKFVGATRPMSSTQLLNLATAQAVGARRADAGEIKRAVAERLFEQEDSVSKTRKGTEEGDGDLRQFAEDVWDAARDSDTGWFGDEKIFISHLYRSFKQRFDGRQVSADDFKARLVKAHLNGYLDLVRADLVQAMEPADVSESEIQHFNGTFHFVKVPAIRNV